MTGRLEEKVAVVTGGGGGIGCAAALAFAREGAAVALVDLRQEAVEAAARKVRDLSPAVIALVADVSDERAVAEAVDRSVDSFGGVDVLLNNAGLALHHALVHTSVEEWDRVMAVNLRGPFLFIKHAAPRMRDGGSIVNVASVAALMAVREAGAYTAAKGGLVSLTRVAAAELAPRIRGGGDVAAGTALTAQKYLLGRLGEAEEIAQAALFLACADSSFVTGSILVADGGVTAQ